MAKKEEEFVRDCDTDSFWLTKIYPDAGASLSFYQLPIEEIRDNCIVVLDANVLLLPYKLGTQSLDELRKVYGALAAADRIFLPAQAVREFLKNRADRVRDVLRDLGNQASQIQILSDKKVGFLQADADYKELLEASEKIRELKRSTLATIVRISDKLRGGIGKDPVSVVYRDIFAAGRVADFELDDKQRQEFLSEMAWRYDHGIPPGYQDRSKTDGGIGDLLIWKTILRLGTERSVHCIFVTEDSKGDWWVQSEGTFQPRIELVEEYRRVTEGKTIHLLPLSSFLATFGAQEQAVDETQQVEIAQREKQRVIQNYLGDLTKLFEEPELQKTGFERLTLSQLLSLKRDFDGAIHKSIDQSRPIRRKLDGSESLPEDELARLLKQEQKLRKNRWDLRKQKSELEREISSRAAAVDDDDDQIS